MASFASSATTCGARKHAWTKRQNDGNNNGQATHGARKHAWRKQALWAKTLLLVFLILKVSSDQNCSIKVHKNKSNGFRFEIMRCATAFRKLAI